MQGEIHFILQKNFFDQLNGKLLTAWSITKNGVGLQYNHKNKEVNSNFLEKEKRDIRLHAHENTQKGILQKVTYQKINFFLYKKRAAE